MMTNTGAANHKISHNDHRHVSAGTLKPDMMGPIAGAPKAKSAQLYIKYGASRGLLTSVIEAPPVAKQGEPKNPCRKRKTMSPGTLSTSAVGTLKTMKINIVAIYGGLRPTDGISERGLKNIGPNPYPRI
ncbi:hypothetical protein EIK77_000725 [Talaromyces pinophilus]|nr:hypothetical protein EIK77_000725 [Talaromyces pinophilus]